MVAADGILEVSELSKSFGGAKALDSVSLAVASNQIVGVVGENGAGKSTLFNIISGIVPADSGSVRMAGRRIAPDNYRQAMLLGISRVFQEQALVPNIPVYENILLSHEDRFDRWGFVDRHRMIATAERIMRSVGLDIDVRRQTGDYDFSIRQSIEIARACLVPQEVLGITHPVVLLDEPTSALQKTEETAFFQLIGRLRSHASLVFVSHRLTEVLAVSDIIYVLKDGRLVATADPRSTTEATLHGLMVGREREADYYHESEQHRPDGSRVVFSVKGLCRAASYDDVSLSVRAGEILGIGGLLESGKSHLGKGAAGVEPADSGSVEIMGDRVAVPDIRHLAKHGLGYVPAERHAEGIILPFSVAWNISLASGEDIFASKLGIWRHRRESAVTRQLIERLRIRCQDGQTPCGSLSGGNQQKVVLGRWLCRDPKVLVLDNPTRGVDAGAKEEIYRLMRQLAARGVGVVLITDELLELIGMSNRIVVMREGRIAALVEAPPEAKPSERHLIELMLGVDSAPTQGFGTDGGDQAPRVLQ